MPFKFEAGTPNVADVIALGTAIDYLQSLDRKAIAAYEKELTEYASAKLKEIEGVQIDWNSERKSKHCIFYY